MMLTTPDTENAGFTPDTGLDTHLCQVSAFRVVRLPIVRQPARQRSPRRELWTLAGHLLHVFSKFEGTGALRKSVGRVGGVPLSLVFLT